MGWDGDGMVMVLGWDGGDGMVMVLGWDGDGMVMVMVMGWDGMVMGW